jgi:NAD(P)-dependent dehydrogenase (short-subunit alcohol dehydrogenase family)
MVRYAAHTHGTHGVRINAVSPGQTLSKGNKWDQMRLNNDPVYQSMVRQTALGRFVTAEEVAQTIYFLASATGITGANIVVDAGYTNAV